MSYYRDTESKDIQRIRQDIFFIEQLVKNHITNYTEIQLL